jgi:hypothetical protein
VHVCTCVRVCVCVVCVRVCACVAECFVKCAMSASRVCFLGCRNHTFVLPVQEAICRRLGERDKEAEQASPR